MKKNLIFSVLYLTLFMPLSSKAFFTCDYNYTSEGIHAETIIQQEILGGQNVLVIRDKNLSLNSNESIVWAVEVTSTEKNKLGGWVVTGLMEMPEHSFFIKLEVILPTVLPGPGLLIFSDEVGDDEIAPLENCHITTPSSSPYQVQNN